MAKTKKTQLRWPKEAIKAEIQRLDGITGLKGANVTVRLYTEPEPLGCFTFIDPVRMTFGFSSTRFEEPGFTKEEALNIIRHEYAHFMEYMIYGESSDHGPNWKTCCRRIGCRADVLYTEEFKTLARAKEKQRVQRTRTDGFSIGKKISHPTFGDGVVEEITRHSEITILTVRFGDTVKKLNIDWIRKNCT